MMNCPYTKVLPIFLEMSLLLILCSINSLMLETVVLLFYKRTFHYPLKLSMQVWRSLAVWKSVVDVLVFISRGVRVKLFLLVLFAFCSVSHVVWQQLRQRWFLIKAKEKSFWITRTDKLCMLKPETFYQERKLGKFVLCCLLITFTWQISKGGNSSTLSAPFHSLNKPQTD